MHNKLDKFVRDKFQERTFEPKNSYWEDAAKMIEHEERWKFWKNFIWLAAGVALFFAGGIGGYYLSSNNQQLQLVGPNTDLPVMDETIAGPTASQRTGVPLLNTPETSAKKDVTLPSVNVRKSEERSTIARSAAASSSGTAHHSESSFTQPSSKLKTNTNNSLNSPGTVYAETQELANKSIIVTDVVNQATAGPSDKEAIQKPILRTLLASELMPLASSFPVLAATSPELQAPLTARTNPNHPVMGDVPSRFSAGIMAGGTGFVHPSDRAGWGSKAGLSIKYKFRPRLSMNADLLYQFRPGSFSHTDESGDIVYRFGKEESLIRLQPTSLHSIQLPVYVQYQIGKHFLESGISASYLLGVRGGQAYHSQRDAGVEPDYEIAREGWIETYGFKNFNTQLLMGYHFGIGRNVSIGFRAGYSIGGILNSNTLPNPSIELQDPGKFDISLMAKCFIF